MGVSGRKTAAVRFPLVFVALLHEEYDEEKTNGLASSSYVSALPVYSYFVLLALLVRKSFSH